VGAVAGPLNKRWAIEFLKSLVYKKQIFCSRTEANMICSASERTWPCEAFIGGECAFAAFSLCKNATFSRIQGS